VRIVFLLSIVALLVLLGPTVVRDVGEVYGSHGMWAMLCIVALSLVTGWVLGGPDEHERRTLSIGTALRNIGLCALVATVRFSATSRVASAVIVYFLLQFISTTIVGIFFTRAAKQELAKQEPAT